MIGTSGSAVLRMAWICAGLLLGFLPALGQKRLDPTQTIVVKLAPSADHPQLSARGSTLQAIFPGKQKLASRGSTTQVGLERLYYLPVPQGSTLEATLAAWQNQPGIEYAVAYPQAYHLQVPNDPEAQLTGGAQNYLEVIQVYEAWDLTTGDTTMVVAILDSGTDLHHPDTEGQVAINYDDPINGLDDDDNGYTDDYYGYDLADMDEDVSMDGDSHGIRVAGMSSATTNNGLGMAGVGYECRYLPVKVFSSEDGMFLQGYEAIVYAADQGAQVINLSWGGTTESNAFVIDLINYAVEERDAVLVAAAGNTAEQLDFYPASVANVLSVGASNDQDEKASFATWGPFIDLLAPGENVYTLDGGDSYRERSGSSFSAPLVAGAAALLRTYRPELNAKQVMQQLRVSADDIYAIGSNSSYAYMLGSGRLNVVDALVDSTLTAVRMENPAYTTSSGPFVHFDDTLYITGEFTSYLHPWTNGSVTLTTSSPYVTLIDSVFSMAELGTLQTCENDTLFKVYLHPDLPATTDILFRLEYSGDNYTDYQHYRITSENPWITVTNGMLRITVGNQGNLGYFEDVRSKGIGWTWNGTQLMDHFGVVLGVDSSRTADNAVSSIAEPQRSQDFTAETRIRRYSNSRAGMDARSWFLEGDSVADPLGIKIQQRWLTDGSASKSPWMVGEYRLVNPTDTVITGLNFGWLADWNVLDEENNVAGYDTLGQLAYVSDTTYNQLVGVAWLGTDSMRFNALDWDDLHGNEADTDSLLSAADKYQLLTTDAPNLEAGTIGAGNDVGLAAGYFVDTLRAGENHALPFALLVGYSLEELRQAAEDARAFYEAYYAEPPLWEEIQICAQTETTLIPAMGDRFAFYADPDTTAPLGVGTSIPFGPVNQDTVVYIVNLDSSYRSGVHRIELIINEPEAQFQLLTDTLVANPGAGVTAKLEEASQGAIAWQWDFGDGTQSQLQSPRYTYLSTGTYTITLTVTNSIGCVDSLARTAYVFERAYPPLVNSANLCLGDSLTISAPNADTLAVYADITLETLVGRGASVDLGVLPTDTTLWVTNQDSLFESQPTRIIISLRSVTAQFTTQPDTTDLDISGVWGVASTHHHYAYEWRTSELIGESDQVYLPLEVGTPFTLTLVVKDTVYGCNDTLSELISPSESPLPDSQVQRSCIGDPVTWGNPGTQYYLFSADSLGESRLAKGRQFTASYEQTDTVWVRGLDSLLPGPASPWVVKISTAEFVAIPALDTFQVSDTTQFLATDPYITQHFWQLDGGSVRTGNPYSNIWRLAGPHTLQLTSLDSMGCIDTSSFSFTVIPRQPVVTGFPVDLAEGLSIFPNPTADAFTLTWNQALGSPSHWVLFDLQGRALLTQPWQGQKSVSLATLPHGPYLLQLWLTNGRAVQHVIYKK